MPTEMIVTVVAVVIVAVATAAWWAMQRQRTARLQDQFGEEYDRTVEQSKDRREAESELQARQERVKGFDIIPLDGMNRARFGERWRAVQAIFVDDPAGAVQQADVLIGEVMRARGYPVSDFEQRAADLSVDHPQVVDHYRTAHRIDERRATMHVDTEQLRQAFVHYRALFAELLETNDARAATDADEQAGVEVHADELRRGRVIDRASREEVAEPARKG